MSEKKPPKPKPICKAEITIFDNGGLAGDFHVWEVDDHERRIRWRVSGEDFFKFLQRVQPNNIPVVASAMNIQIVRAGLPEHLQGKWLKRGEEGKLELAQGNYLATPQTPPGVEGAIGDQIADQEEIRAANEVGLDAEGTAAALPNNETAQRAAQEDRSSIPATPVPTPPSVTEQPGG